LGRGGILLCGFFPPGRGKREPPRGGGTTGLCRHISKVIFLPNLSILGGNLRGNLQTNQYTRKK